MEREHFDWPFFEDRHRRLATELDAWAASHVHDAQATTSMPPAARW